MLQMNDWGCSHEWREFRLGAGVEECSGRSSQTGRLRGLHERECPEPDGKGENDWSLTEVEGRRVSCNCKRC